jgi:aminopeptidase N
MPQPYTYGNLKYWVSTTYQKGADVMHTLRTYMGDSAFFKGMRYYFDTHMYQPVSTDTLKNSLERSSGLGLTDFFNDWVKAPGFDQFSIDSMQSIPSGPNYSVTVYIKQKLMGAPAYYNNVPIDVTFKAANWTTNTQTVLMSGQTSNYTFTVPFNPVFAGLNMKVKVGEAVSPDTLIIKKTGTYNMTDSRVDLTVNSISDSAYLFLEHNYVAPDPVKNLALHYRISPYRYWKVSGIRPANFSATATLYFDGRKGTYTSGPGYLDTALTEVTRDSLILLYRPNTASDWEEFPGYTKHTIGPATMMYGYMKLDSLPNGEYTFANGVSHVLGIQSVTQDNYTLKVYPNPTSNDFTVVLSSASSKQYIYLYDMQGKLVKQLTVEAGQTTCIIESSVLESGTYVVTLSNGNTKLASQRIVIAH